MLGCAGVAVVIIIWMVVSYNKLVKAKMKVENSWGQINIQLKMRADLVPNLIETVKGYARHEKETLTQVMEARNKYMTAIGPKAVIDSSSEISGLMGRLFAAVENYPQLRADQNFLNLQQELGEIEKKISVYRQFYNDTVMLYNRHIITFPRNIAAAILGFEKFPFFQIDDGEKAMPQVKF